MDQWSVESKFTSLESLNEILALPCLYVVMSCSSSLGQNIVEAATKPPRSKLRSEAIPASSIFSWTLFNTLHIRRCNIFSSSVENVKTATIGGTFSMRQRDYFVVYKAKIFFMVELFVYTHTSLQIFKSPIINAPANIRLTHSNVKYFTLITTISETRETLF